MENVYEYDNNDSVNPLTFDIDGVSAVSYSGRDLRKADRSVPEQASEK